jgi:Ca2+-transporting ATPase
LITLNAIVDWHTLHIDKVFELTGGSPRGINSGEASERLKEYGPNSLIEKKRTSPLLIFLHQFRDFMIIVLMTAAIISGFIGDITDTIIIITIILLNAIIGFIQEYRAEKAMEALKKMASVRAMVLRDGKSVNIPSEELVPGDLVLLESGNVVPADLRLMDSLGLLVNESALTGESLASSKNAEIITGQEIPLGDRFNMAYKSTLVNVGRGSGIVVSTGMKTEIGRIANLLQEDETQTPLKKRMADFGKKLSYIILLICFLLFGIGLIRGEEPLQMLMISISLAVAAIPEALPALITIALAMGAKKMMFKNALIRKLPAVETLGSISYICSDKTGTLTLNRMKVVKMEEVQATALREGNITPFLAGLALNNDVKQTASGELHGDPTEIALVEAVKEKLQDRFYKVSTQFPRIAELPFDSDRKCMTTVHRYGKQFLVLSKGAVESIAKNISASEDIQGLEKHSLEWAAKGIRVIAFGYSIIDEIPKPFSHESVEKDLHISGIAGMIDPPREEITSSITECKTAGIKPVMITGDHPATAISIAREIGIYGQDDLAVTGPELQLMDDDEFSAKVEHISVYARVSPEQKLRIVRALQARHHFVSMTGDGVNDAPSLKAADIGIAMGINGTDVSKEVADMILLDDNFSTIVKAVREGRRIYDNIRKFVKYILTCNGAEIMTIFIAPLIGLPMPLLPIQILWINLVTDGLPGLALASEKAEKDIMQRPPRPSGESLFSGGISVHIVWVGILMAVITLSVEAFALHQQSAHWQTMVFTVLSLSQLGHVLAIRSEKEFLFRQGLFSNIPLLSAVFLTCILQIAVIYLPAANAAFKTQPLTWKELIISLLASAVLFHAVELEKWIKSLNPGRRQEIDRLS